MATANMPKTAETIAAAAEPDPEVGLTVSVGRKKKNRMTQMSIKL